MADIKQIQFKRTSEAGKKPTPEALAEGELAINLADRMLFTKSGNEVIDLGFAKGGEVDGDINQVKGNIITKGDVTAKNGNFDYTVRIERSGAQNPSKMLAIQSDGTSTNDMLIQHWGNGAARESILEFKFGTSKSHPITKMGMLIQRATDDTVSFEVNGRMRSADYIVSESFIRGGGSNGVQITSFPGGAAPTRLFQIGNFSSATYENAVQFTDGTNWLGELGTRKTIRPSNQTKTEFKVNGNITSIGNAESFRLVYQDYGTFWRNDGASLYLMQTDKGDSDGSFNSLRPFRLNLVSGDLSLHTTTIQNQPGKNWVGIGAAVTPNTDQLGVAGLGTFVAVGDSDTGIGQRGDGNLDILANNVAALKVTSARVLTTRAFTAQIQDSAGRIAMPANNNAILTIDGSAEPNQTTNGVTLIGYNSGDKYHHYFRGNGNFVVNMPYATFDKDAYFGGYINAAYIHSRGSIYTGAVPQATYKWDDLNTSAANNAKSYLRRWRSQGNAIIWHETCTQAEVIISTGATDTSPVWGYNTGGIWTNGALSAKNASLNGTGGGNSVVILQDGQTVTGEPNGLVRGAIEGGAWVNWRSRASGLQVNIDRDDSAYNIWKATLWGKNHVAAMEVIHNASIVDAAARIQVHNTNFDFSASGGFSTPARGYFGSDLTTAANLRATGAIYWGPNGAWAASDGNIYGTQWGEGGALAWMGGNVVKTWGNITKKGNLDVQGVLRCTGGSDFHTYGATIHNTRTDFMYVRADGEKSIRFQPANASGTQASILANAGYIRLNPGAGNFEFKNNNEFYCPGNGNFNDVYIRSDRNAKRNIVEIDNALDRLSKMAGMIYEVTDESGNWNQSVGLIAQDAQDALPELVHMDDKDLLRLNYNGVIGLLVSAVNNLRKQVDELKK